MITKGMTKEKGPLFVGCGTFVCLDGPWKCHNVLVQVEEMLTHKDKRQGPQVTHGSVDLRGESGGE